MSEKFFNSIIAAFISCFSAIGTVWFLSDDSEMTQSSEKFSQLEVDSLRINQDLTIYSINQPNEPLIELKNGHIFAQNGIYSGNIGALQIMGQKLQITTGDPTSEESPIFSELSTNEDGGACFALLSPQGTHSINFGFDKMETGYIISQNNQDKTMKAQAILAIPRLQESQANQSQIASDFSGDLTSPQPSDFQSDNNASQAETILESSHLENFVQSDQIKNSINPVSSASAEPETAMSSDFSNIPETRIH
ncbi:MAG: hypothetical protein Q4C95_07625 [Planctomycetia bacterium]|nr:hypothetical protein [Planctomycetia bacterium]